MTLYVGDEQEADAQVEDRARCLCRIEDGEVFAYMARGNEFVRVRDHGLWAVAHDDVLVSARSGAPLAYRRGRVYYASETDEPLYYERAH